MRSILKTLHLNTGFIQKLLRFKNFGPINGIVIFVVLIPNLCAILYFGVIASDVYISKSTFVIRAPAAAPMRTSGLSSILSTIGIAPAANDSFVAVNYLYSKDAMMKVNQVIDLKKLFTSQSIDVFNRFASFYWNDSYERLLQYFNNHLSVNFDPTANVIHLEVRSYTPQSSYEINRLLLMNTDKLINAINEQARNDLIEFSSKGVAIAQADLEKANLALIQFRTQDKSKVGDNYVADFIKLEGERQTAQNQLNASMAALQQARIDAQRKLLYLETISPPTVPDYPLEPKRIMGIVNVFFLSLLFYGMLRMLLAGVREHRD